MNEDYLIHYGVLGMKWGVHKAARAERKSNIKTGKKTSGAIGKIGEKVIKQDNAKKNEIARGVATATGLIAGGAIGQSTAATAGAVVVGTLAGSAVGAVAATAVVGTAAYAYGRKKVNDYYEQLGAANKAVKKVNAS